MKHLAKSNQPCQVRGCQRPRHAPHTRCQVHHDRWIEHGTTEKSTGNGKADKIGLSPIQRKPWVRSALAILKRRVRGRKFADRHLGYQKPAMPRDAALIQLLHDITALLKFRIDRHLRLADWRHLKPAKKAEALLLSVHKRWPDGDTAALVLVSTIIGTLLACRLEPGIERGETFASFAIMRAISGALVRAEVTTTTSEHAPVRNGVVGPSIITTHVDKGPKPRATGRYLVANLERLIVAPIRYYMEREAGADLERQVLQHMITHKSAQRSIRLFNKSFTTNQTKKKKGPKP